TECDHRARARLLEQSADELLLGSPERGLSVRAELLGHRVAKLLFEQAIAVECLHSQRGRHFAGDGRLAGAHEADEDERAAGRVGYERHRWRFRRSPKRAALKAPAIRSAPNMHPAPGAWRR